METILVATDFSKPANGAVEYAAHLARYFSAKLVIVNAFKMPLQGYNALSPLSVAAELRQDSENKLNLIRNNLIGRSYDFGIETGAELGDTVTVLEDIVNTYSADLVVMGITGEGSVVKEKLIGSTAISAARKLRVPVLIVPEKVDYKTIRRISLACDLENIEESTLLYSARSFAGLFDAELEIVTVQKNVNDIQKMENENHLIIEKRLNTVKHKQVFLKEENVEITLEYYFKFHDTDLVIVNPKKHGLFERLFSGSVTRHLAFHSRVPLLIIR